MDKNNAFSFLIDKFIEWYSELESNEEYTNKFTKLFLLKMLFLVAAIKTDDAEDLLDVFDNFHALPYGPVESDVYNSISKDVIPNYTISDRQLVYKRENQALPLSDDEKQTLERSFEKLKESNERLISLGAFELVEITHKWESWDKTFKYAKFAGLGSAKMDLEMIRKDRRSYFGD